MKKKSNIVNCEYCGKEVGKENIQSHYSICESAKKICDLCDEKITISKFQEHKKKCENELIVCRYCKNPFKKGFLLNHMKQKHIKLIIKEPLDAIELNKLSETLYLKCEICNNIIKKNSTVNHFKTNHVEELNDLFLNTYKKNIDLESIVSCEHCNFKKLKYKNFFRHIYRYHKTILEDRYYYKCEDKIIYKKLIENKKENIQFKEKVKLKKPSLHYTGNKAFKKNDDGIVEYLGEKEKNPNETKDFKKLKYVDSYYNYKVEDNNHLSKRDNGQFGSLPMHDNYEEESNPD